MVMFQVVPVEQGYRIEWQSKDKHPVPLAFEWDKIYTGPSAQSNAYRRRRQLNRLVQVQQALIEVGGSWWAGPYKTGKGNGKYYIHPNRDDPRQEDISDFPLLDALATWIEQKRQTHESGYV